MSQPQPHTQPQYDTILRLQGQLGGSTRFVEPRIAYGSHPEGFTLNSKNADELIELLRRKLLSKETNAHLAATQDL